MKLLFITHYFEPNSGSSSDQFTRMAKILVRRGHDVTVLTTLPHYPQGRIAPDYRGKLWKVEQRDGVQVIYSWLWATPAQRISRRLLSQMSFMLPAILRGLALPRPDMAFIEAQPIFTGLAGRIISRLKGVPYVLNVSDLWPDHLLTVGAMRETSRVYRIAREAMDSGYRGASAIICMSPAWARKVAEYIGGQSEKIHTIYRGVDTTLFVPGRDTRDFRARHHLSAKKLVTFIGTFATQYDFAPIFAAAAHFRSRDEVDFVLIGTGSQRDTVVEHINAQKLPNLQWIDWMAHDEMPLAWCASYLNIWAMRRVDLYTGTIPAKIYEAFAAGTPVVAAQSGECAALIATSGGGLTVQPGDTAGFIALIERLLNDEALQRQHSQNARRYAEQHFDFEAAVRQHEAIFLQAAGKR